MSLDSIRKEKGFWDGGGRTARESGGKSSGHPGSRETSKQGVSIELDERPKRKSEKGNE